MLLFLVGGSCSRVVTPGPSPVPSQGGGATVAVAGLGALDPAAATAEASLMILRTACDGLLALDDDGNTVGGVAESWRLDEAERKLILELRDGVSYQDGEPVDARSAAESISRVARPETASPWAHLLSTVVGFEELRAGAANSLTGVVPATDRRLEISLVRSAEDFPWILTHPALVLVSPRAETFDPPVCAGPYRIEAPTEGEARLERVAYSGVNEAFDEGGRGFFDVVTFRSMDTPEAAWEAFMKKEADAARVPDAAVGSASGERGHFRRDVATITYLGFDVTRSPTANRSFRKAISLSIDRLAVIDAAFGDRRRPAQRWLPGEGVDEAMECRSYARRLSDIQAASSLMGGVKVGPAPVPFFFDSSGAGRLVAQALVVQIRDALGVGLDLRPMEEAALIASIGSREGPGIWMLEGTPSIPVPARMLGLLSGGSPAGALGFSDPEFEALLARAGGISDPEARDAVLGQAEEILCTRAPAIPLWNGVRHWSVDPLRVGFGDSQPIDIFGGLALRDAQTPG